jgi:hypothetical protein
MRTQFSRPPPTDEEPFSGLEGKYDADDDPDRVGCGQP